LGELDVLILIGVVMELKVLDELGTLTLDGCTLYF